jgi:hypothetical protein
MRCKGNFAACVNAISPLWCSGSVDPVKIQGLTTIIRRMAVVWLLAFALEAV